MGKRLGAKVGKVAAETLITVIAHRLSFLKGNVAFNEIEVVVVVAVED